MPFDYKHREEQNITNSNVTILFDYGTNMYSYKIAAYKFLYGKGKVIRFGIYGDDLIKQYGNFMRIDAAFPGFLDRIILNNIINY